MLDFGCGRGQLLKNLRCAERLGVEPSPVAREAARANGVRVFESTEEVPDGSVNVVITNHALEHTLHPLIELQTLHRKLRPGGHIVVVVPCEPVSWAFRQPDHDHQSTPGAR